MAPNLSGLADQWELGGGAGSKWCFARGHLPLVQMEFQPRAPATCANAAAPVCTFARCLLGPVPNGPRPNSGPWPGGLGAPGLAAAIAGLQQASPPAFLSRTWAPPCPCRRSASLLGCVSQRGSLLPSTHRLGQLLLPSAIKRVLLNKHGFDPEPQKQVHPPKVSPSRTVA